MNWKFLDVDIGHSVYSSRSKMDFFSDWGGIIGAGIAAAGSVAGNAVSANAAQDLDETNRDWQERMWNQTNEYNSTKNQRKRLEEAGINPSLAFHSGAVACCLRRSFCAETCLA